MGELPERRDAQLEARKLRATQVQRNDARGIARQEGKRVVARGRHRQADITRLHVEATDENIGILPHLAVADVGEVNTRRDVRHDVSRHLLKRAWPECLMQNAECRTR